MNTTRLSSLVIALLGVALAQADQNSAMEETLSGAVVGAQGLAEAPDNLHDAMEIMGKSLKGLRKLAEDDWDGGAALVLKARQAAYLAIGMIPSQILEIPDAKVKAMEVANYQRLSSQAYADLCQLELAYRSQDAEAVKTAKKKVMSTKREGHDKYED